MSRRVPTEPRRVRDERPSPNSVLALRVGPISREAKSGGKGRARIRGERLPAQCILFAGQFREIGNGVIDARLYNGCVGLVVERWHRQYMRVKY